MSSFQSTQILTRALTYSTQNKALISLFFMPRRYRRYYRSYYPRKSLKYSSETFNGMLSLLTDTPSTNTQENAVITPALDTTQGTRKVKNFTLSLNCQSFKDNVAADGSRILFALVFVPEGTNPSQVHVANGATASVYEPNQNVIMSGLIDDKQVYRFKTRLGRNLNSGDAIYLVLYDLNQIAEQGHTWLTNVYAQVNYAIAF